MRNCFTQNVQGTECPFMFIAHELHKKLCFLACIEIGENTAFYDPESSRCHSLLRRYDIVAPELSELIRELSSAGTSCCVGALITLSYVLHIPISSYYSVPSNQLFLHCAIDRRHRWAWSQQQQEENCGHVVDCRSDFRRDDKHKSRCVNDQHTIPGVTISCRDYLQVKQRRRYVLWPSFGSPSFGSPFTIDHQQTHVMARLLSFAPFLHLWDISTDVW